jgi:(p)ppGpp synthase/HD superfamily hydrolase
VEITVRASNKAGLLAKILNEFSRFGCTINSTNTSTKSNQFSMRFNAQINNSNHLEKLLERIQKIAGVQDCRRG